MSSKAVENLRVAFVRDGDRRSIKTQTAMVKADGIERVYRDWELLIRQRRKGVAEVIVVTDMWVIADPTQRTIKGGMFRSVIARRAEARRVGASIFELSTGRSTLHPDDADAMLLDARDALSGVRSTNVIGRRPVVWTDAERQLIELHWLSPQYSNDRAAIAVMRASGIKSVWLQRVRHEFGPSGRKPGTTGPRPARKKKPKPRRKRGATK